MVQPEIGHKISEERKTKGFTQSELAEEWNAEIRTIQKIETGEVTPRLFTLRTINEKLGTNFDINGDSGIVKITGSKKINRTGWIAGITLIFFIVSCQNDESSIPPQEVLNYYTIQSETTDPGKYDYLYDELPESLEELCSLIKCQLIHPVEIGVLKDKLPKVRHYEDPKYPTVERILEGFLKYDERGLTYERKPEDRLILACFHHTLLLASILRHRGIPVRIRTGFARYYEEKINVRFGHTICEVWDAGKQKWIWVDPDRKFVDFEHNKFELPQKSWKNLRKNRLKTKLYKGGFSKGEYSVTHMLVQDIVTVVKTETQYWNEPAFLDKGFTDIDELDEKKLLVLDRFANLLETADDSLSQIIELYYKTDWIQPSGSTWDETIEKFGIEF